MHLLTTQMVSFGEIHVLHHLRGIGPFATKWSFLYLENYDLQEIFLSKSNSSLTRKQCGRCSTSNTDGFLSRYACVLSTHLKRPIATKWDFLHLEKYDWLQFSSHKLSHVSQGKNVLELLLLRRVVFFQAMHVFLQLTWRGLFGNRLIWKMSLFDLENCDLQE
jgi:hypothetical protein